MDVGKNKKIARKTSAKEGLAAARNLNMTGVEAFRSCVTQKDMAYSSYLPIQICKVLYNCNQ